MINETTKQRGDLVYEGGIPADDHRDGEDEGLIDEISARPLVARVAWSDESLDDDWQLSARGTSDNVFASPNRGGKATIDPATLGKLIKRLYGDRATVHGFRSSFRTWASERTNVTRDICEMALAHRVGSDVERSYAHSDLFDKRRALMNAWAAYVTDSRAEVILLHA